MKDQNQTGSIQEITQKQKETWSKGDFNEIARLNVMIAEELVNVTDPHSGQKVLDNATGSGTLALTAARRYCDVTGIDYVPELIDRAKRRSEASGFRANFLVADAQALPFPDNSFDFVLSVYGVQFAPDQEKAAAEMIRVCKPGGTIGLAGPLPEGWSGDFFGVHGKYVPLPDGMNSPLRWGTVEGLNELFGENVKSIKTEKKKSIQYFLSTDHALDVFKTWFGPTLNALEKIEENQKENLLRDLKAVFDRYNISEDDTAVVENIYLQTIIEI